MPFSCTVHFPAPLATKCCLVIYFGREIRIEFILVTSRLFPKMGMSILCPLYLPFAIIGSRDRSHILRMTNTIPGSDYLTLFCYVTEKYTFKLFKPLYFCISLIAAETTP